MGFSVTVVTPDVVGDRMAGPGIRAWQLATELGRHFPTTLVAKLDGSTRPEGVTVAERGSAAGESAIRDASVLLGQPARGFRRRTRGQRIVYDLFDPNVLELRELYGAAPSVRQRVHLAAEWWRLSDALMRADLLVCATPRQREFYARLQSSDTPWVEVPFGVDPAELGTCEKSRDNIVIWGGGVWEWLDPATAVDAVVQVNASGVRCKLLFLGLARPNRELIDRRRENRFDELLERGGDHVSANEEWIPYRERLSWLRAAKIAIMLHRRTAEAGYSIRIRLYDAIAAGTPVVASAGGYAAELVEREGLGVVVEPGDPDAVADAIRRLLTDDDFYSRCVSNLERIRPQLAWQVVVSPLVNVLLEWRQQVQK